MLERFDRASELLGDDPSPSPRASIEAFDTSGRRPEELLRAFEILRGTAAEGTSDGRSRTVAASLAASAADAELAKVSSAPSRWRRSADGRIARSASTSSVRCYGP